MARIAAIAAAVAFVAGCAGEPSSRYDGAYELSSTPAKGYEGVCPTDRITVRVVGGKLDFTVHPPDEWHGYVDGEGYFHGQGGYGERTFKLTDGIMVPGQIAPYTPQVCQYLYRFAPVR